MLHQWHQYYNVWVALLTGYRFRLIPNFVLDPYSRRRNRHLDHTTHTCRQQRRLLITHLRRKSLYGKIYTRPCTKSNRPNFHATWFLESSPFTFPTLPTLYIFGIRRADLRLWYERRESWRWFDLARRVRNFGCDGDFERGRLGGRVTEAGRLCRHLKDVSQQSQPFQQLQWTA